MADNGCRHVLTIFAVDSLERSRRFYDDVFGWRVAENVPVYVEYNLPGGQRFGLYAREGYARNTGILPPVVGEDEITGAEVYFHTDDPTPVIERLRRAGAKELSPFSLRDWGDEAAYWRDPDGNVLVIAKTVGD